MPYGDEVAACPLTNTIMLVIKTLDIVFFSVGVALWTCYQSHLSALPAGTKPDAVLLQDI